MVRTVQRMVESIYAAAESRISMPPGPGEMARRLLGTESLCCNERSSIVRSELTRHRGNWRIWVSPSLTDAETSYEVAHKLGKWWCRDDVTQWREFEELLTAGIILPMPALAFADRVLGLSAADIAEAYVCPIAVVRLQMWRLARRRTSGTHRRFDSVG